MANQKGRRRMVRRESDAQGPLFDDFDSEGVSVQESEDAPRLSNHLVVHHSACLGAMGDRLNQDPELQDEFEQFGINLSELT
jgi:hypothetical protein